MKFPRFHGRPRGGRTLAVSAFFSIALTAAQGKPLTWSFVNAIFDDGGGVTGAFVLDADSGMISTWSVSVTSGSKLQTDFTFDPKSSRAAVIQPGVGGCRGASACVQFFSNQTFPVPGGGLSLARILTLDFSDALSDIPETVNITSRSIDCLNCSPGRSVATGCVTSNQATSCPELSFALVSKPMVLDFNPERGLATGDFNLDGKPDLVLVNRSGGNLTLLFGDGAGGFTPGAAAIQVGSFPVAVAVGDFDRNGKLDIATVNNAGSSVTVLLGDGTGSFKPAPGSPVSTGGSSPYDIAVADFTSDGIADLAVTNVYGGLTTLRGRGDGTFAVLTKSFETLNWLLSVVAGDFNKDGRLDLALIEATETAGKLIMIVGDGNGAFSLAFETSTGVNRFGGLAAADLNDDGKPDLVAQIDGKVTILLGDGAAKFTPVSGGPDAPGAGAIAIADFNGDGNNDIVLSRSVQVLLGDGTGKFAAAPGSPFAPTTVMNDVAPADFNLDGKLDLALPNSFATNLWILLNKFPPSPPAVKQGAVVPIFGSSNSIQPGEWVSIYGASLASSTMTWKGDFPTSLGGTSVTIDGKPAYLWFVSPTQINLQAPDSSKTGPVPVVVKTDAGSISSTVNLAPFAPCFSLLDNRHVAGVIIRSVGFDIIGPTGGSLGYPTVAARAGDTIALYAVGLGPTNPAVPAGQAPSGLTPVTSTVELLINKVKVAPLFTGLVSAGLYQINVTLPAGLGEGEVPMIASVGGVQTQTGVVISLQ